MPGVSDRDKCFGEAVEAWNDSHPDDQLPIETQQPWVFDNGQWRPANALDKMWNWMMGTDPYRYPDWTIDINGQPVAGDNKFSGDRFSNRKGRSGKTQLEDQNDMNDGDYDGLNLNPKDCDCPDEPEPEEVKEFVTSPESSPFAPPGWQFNPGVPNPGWSPSPGVAPSPGVQPSPGIEPGIGFDPMPVPI
jgi:hypothetical protein